MASIVWAAGPMNWELVGATLALLGLILFGIMALVMTKRWWERQGDVSLPDVQTKSFEALYAEGVLSREELEKIRAQLEKKANAPATAPPAVPESSAPPDKPV